MSGYDWEHDYDFDKDEDLPNVVKLTLPRNHAEEGAAWVYVPSKHTVYIGDFGTYHLDLADTLKHVIDVKKGEKLVSGVLEPSGYVDYFSNPENGDEILKAVKSYFHQNYDEEGREHGEVTYYGNDPYVWDTQTETWIPEDEFYAGGGEDKGTGKSYYDTSENVGDWQSYTYGGGREDRDEIDPTTNPLGEGTKDWDQVDFKAWADKRKREDYSHSWSPREAKPHFRWSFGDKSIAPEAPHEGLFMWPVENGWPDHHSQTGWKGLGYCAQGRVYPHVGDRYEILTWPDRPRQIGDQQVRKAYKLEAQQAAKDWVIENLGADPDKIFFTEGQYGDMVSNWNSPTYPDIGRMNSPSRTTYYSDPEENPYEIKYDDSDGSAYYTLKSDDEYVDEHGNVTVGPGWNQNPLFDEHGTAAQEPGRKSDPAKILQNVIKGRGGEAPAELSDTQWYAMTPEERYQYKIDKFEQQQEQRRQEIQTAYSQGTYDPLTHTVGGVPYKQWAQQKAQDYSERLPKNDSNMSITDYSGITHVVTPEEYQEAKEELGDQWWRKFMGTREAAMT